MVGPTANEKENVLRMLGGAVIAPGPEILFFHCLISAQFNLGTYLIILFTIFHNHFFLSTIEIRSSIKMTYYYKVHTFVDKVSSYLPSLRFAN